MKKCPECGNPSYDGAPVCGNCGFKFPKPKVAAPKQESIFDKAPKEKKKSSKSAKSDDQSTLAILKKNRLLIGIILLITLIVICGIVLFGSNNDNGSVPTTGDLLEFTNGDFSFKYPGNWIAVNGTDESHSDAVFFENGNSTTIEYYNSTLESSTLNEITLERINYAQESGSYVQLVETITLDGRNATNIIFENFDGTFTRYVSMFDNGDTLHVFKISGPSISSITNDEITSVLNSANIA
ncbi:zinc ribbon domain-containing protein [Methanobrevibacter sp.]|uniref:zinc ribbon domain-containing protein n=1 Tax=Methanobrevibacter sp. TaxID=66852 RepID=UPI0038688EBE